MELFVMIRRESSRGFVKFIPTTFNAFVDIIDVIYKTY